jgi:tetratricopeptide (TPR) repeat protein
MNAYTEAFMSNFNFTAALIATSLVISGCVTKTNTEHDAVAEADQLASEGLIKEAIEKYKVILVRSPNNRWARRNLGLVSLRAKDYQGTITNLEAAVDHFTSDFDVSYSLAEAYRVTEKYPEAIFRYQKALELTPRDSRALKGIAWSYYKLRYLPEALASIRQIRHRPGGSEDGQTAIIEARILKRMDRFDDALKAIRSAKQGLEEKAGLAYLLSVEGEIFAARGDCVAANRIFRDALKRQPLLPSSLLGLGKCLIMDNKPELAIEYLERAIRIRPSLTEGYLLLGDALKGKDKPRAMKYFKKFRQLAANDPEWLDQLRTLSTRIDSELSISNDDRSNR